MIRPRGYGIGFGEYTASNEEEIQPTVVSKKDMGAFIILRTARWWRETEAK